MKRSDLIQLMTFLSEIYENQFEFPIVDDIESNESKIRSWMVFLADIPFEPAMMICKIYCERGNPFPPNPGQIVKMYKESIKPEEERLTAEEAWEKILKIIQGSGYSVYKEKEFTENLPVKIQYAIRTLGGLRAVAMSKKNDPFIRHNFIDAYEKLSERQRKNEEYKKLDNSLNEIKRITR